MLRQKIYQEVEDIATVEQESTTTIVRVPIPYPYLQLQFHLK